MCYTINALTENISHRNDAHLETLSNGHRFYFLVCQRQRSEVMTKKELEQYSKLKKEIGTLERKIDKLREKEIPEVMGVVQSSEPYFPYLPCRISVKMYEPKQADTIEKMLNILEKRVDRCNEEMIKIEKFIDQIADSELRQIFEWRYMEGMKLREIADGMNLDRSSIGKKITSYLQLSHNSQKNVI